MRSSVLVWTAVLQLLPVGHSLFRNPLQNDPQCWDKCPAGYHKVGKCNTGQFRCQKCVNSFTSIENYVDQCEECTICSEAANQKVSKKCAYNKDTECVCQDGYYKYENNDGLLHCFPCSDQECSHPNCERAKCNRPPEVIKSRETTTASATTAVLSTSSGVTMESVEPLNLLLVVVVVAVLVGVHLALLWLLVVVCIYRSRRSKKLESVSPRPDPDAQDAPPTAAVSSCTLNVCEEDPPGLLFSESPLAPSIHCTPLLRPLEAPGGPTAPWPAAVLYSVIQEVPLRRWKELLRLLGVTEQQMERVELEAGYRGSRETQYQTLRLWTRRPAAAMPDLLAALHRMELRGCAQRIQDRLGGGGVDTHPLDLDPGPHTPYI